MSTIPVQVNLAELVERLGPLLDLLGVTARDVFDDPGIHINVRTGVVFTVPLDVDVPAAAIVRKTVVGDDEWAEHAIEVKVEVFQ